MKFLRLLILLISCLLVVSCSKKKQSISITPDAQKTHLQREHIYGMVKIVIDSTYSVGDSTTSSFSSDTLRGIVAYNYSADGWLNGVVKMNAMGDTLSVRKIFYDDRACMVSSDVYDSSGHCIEHIIYENDKNGRRLKEQDFVQDSLLQTLVYQNDGFGNVIGIKMMTSQFSMERKYINNEYGLVTRIDEYDPDGKLFKSVSLEYDNYGDLVNRRVCRNDGVLLEYTHIQMDKDGRLLKSVYEDMLYKTKEVTIFAKHDRQKNWLQKIKKIGEKPRIKIERTIIYY